MLKIEPNLTNLSIHHQTKTRRKENDTFCSPIPLCMDEGELCLRHWGTGPVLLRARSAEETNGRCRVMS
jgi:hypothetical protein